MRSQMRAATPRSWVTNSSAALALAARAWRAGRARGLDGHVERRRRLVGDDRGAGRARAPSRSSRAGAGRRRARADRQRAFTSGSGMPVSASSSSTRSSLGAAGGLRDLRADAHRRVERRHRVLEDRRRGQLPRRRAAVVLGGGDHVLAGEPDGAADDRRAAAAAAARGRSGRARSCPSPTRRRARGSRRARSTRLGAAQRMDVAAGGRERHVQVLDLEDRRASRLIDAHAGGTNAGHARRPRANACEHLGAADEAVALQVGHRRQRGVVRGAARSRRRSR